MAQFFVLFLLPALTQAAAVNPLGIYGDDNRVEFYELRTEIQKVLTEASVALISAKNLKREGDMVRLGGKTYGDEANLCPNERFFDQPSAAFCSGVLVAPDLVLTAGHCVESQRECKTIKFVFGYNLTEAGQNPRKLPRSEVYECEKIVSRELTPGFELPADGADYALVKLSRRVTGHRPLDFLPTGGPQQGEEIAAYGYPSGLPMKFIVGAHVRHWDQSTFWTNLDTYGGNSGSPVVSMATGKLEGILIEGDDDFEKTKDGCYISKWCPDDGCRGERVMKIDEILKRIAGK